MSIFSALLTADKGIIDRAAGKVLELYGSMGKAYNRSALSYDFFCTGCEENCCEERFYHHTLSEFFCLLRGLQSLEEGKRAQIFDKAREVLELYRMHDLEGPAKRLMCPLNSDGRCSLYEYRLMICRLHGIPYKMRRPNGAETLGIGCNKVDRNISPEMNAEYMLDRTDLYRDLSGIEIELRQKLGFSHRINMTIAEMITEIEKLLKKSEGGI